MKKMQNSELLQQLCQVYGVLDSYQDAFGRQIVSALETKALVLEAMGLNVDSKEGLEYELHQAPKLPKILLLENSYISFELAQDRLQWRLSKDSSLLFEGESEKQNGKFELRFDLPIGYYDLELLELDIKILIVSAPTRAYLPEILEHKKLWGLTCQLYSLRKSEQDCFGDFSALREMKNLASSFGASFLGLNPLLATGFPSQVGVSPYSPISRHALNEIYIEADIVGKQDKQIDYQDVADKKYQKFLQGFKQSAEFLAFKNTASAELLNYAIYSVLREKFGKTWQTWPVAYRDPTSLEVSEFKRINQEQIDFYLYLQWQADKQLRSLSSKNFSSDCVLYLDFPVGVSLSSSDVWANQSLFALNASAGAPPDELAPQGQSWGLPPFIPGTLLEQSCRPFINALRFSMQYAGAIRIDHVMSLWRLYWSVGNGDGAYVRYPARELTSIVKLESHLQQCVVIGEDLGTVPEKTKQFMSTSGVLSYKVFYFEKDSENFKAPEFYPKESLCCVGTHDLAPLKGYLEKADLSERTELKLHRSDVLSRLDAVRNKDLQALARFLSLANLDFAEVLEKLYTKLAQSNSMLLAVQLEDLCGQSQQVNLPGTVEERPNWKQYLPVTIKGIQEIWELLMNKDGHSWRLRG